MCFNKGDRVRWNYNNAIGEVTGRVIGSRINVKFNEGEYRYIESQNLELVPSDECIFSRFDNRAFSGIDDYRRALNRYRLSGGLTDIMYSMSNARTEFFPHQFLPVTKFLESFTGRLLIADEVGLGKTIEAMYIWEELRARSNARKLLIVAPAVLRMKWKNDLERFFNIDATIVRAQGGNGSENLLGRLKHLVSHPGRDSFVYIVSLEGLRTSRDLESLLEDSAEVRSLFDLVIIDEAHYMRNSGTRSFKFGARLRDVSEHLLLLSATPIQTSSDNFYNLLRLLGPEEFDSQILFETRLNDLIPVVKLTNALEAGAQEAVVRQMLDIACVMPAFALDADCRYLKSHLEEVLSDTAKRVWMIKRLKGKFFYDQYVTRTRKRDVMENRTVRRACAVQFALTQVEREMYWRVTDFLSSRDPGGSGFSVFRLIIRQRQMASCMPAALMAWRGQEVRQSASMSDAEYVDGERESLLDDVLGDVRCDDADDFVMPTFDEIDLNQLVASDSKFNAILGQLQDILSENAGEKIVIFTFFRGTVAYLYDRLKAAGISVEYLIGGMPSDEKTQRIERFRDCGVSVLVSSEVGSEGIDLQFARHEINYDLPWNPMRLEQRIGRIDRIGQKSPEIFIYNAFCESTIEDRILNRLYGRIERFRSIIGDLEEILGNVVQSLEIDVFRKRKMSDAEIDAKLRQIDQAVENRRMMSQELEKDAGYLTAYQRHVLDNIKRARTNVRRLTPKETLNTVKSFLNANYPGSSVRAEDGDGMTTICLSDAARASLTKYLEDNPQPSGTRLNYSRDGVLCDFDNSRFVKESRIVEKVDVNHPLMKWILTELNRDISTLSGCELLRVGRCFLENASEIPSGSYFYYVQNWQVDGIRRINELHYYVASVESGESLGPDLSERLMIAALLNGDTRDVGSLGDEEFARAQEVLQVCVEGAFEEFDRFVDDQKSQNVNLVAQQKLYVEQTTSKKLEKFRDTIGKLVADGKSSAAKMWKGKMDKVLQDKNARLARLEEVLQGQATASDVATGIITVEDV